MKNLKLLTGIGVVIVIAIGLLVALFVSMHQDTYLQFKVIDKISRNWVFDCTIEFQNRVIRSYYQSNKGPVEMEFTGLSTGTHKLIITAPHYLPVEMDVPIRGGKNVINNPIEMTGYEIPGVRRFFIFPKEENNGIKAEMRPAVYNEETRSFNAVVNHPCMNLFVGCIISVQMKDGVFVTAPTEEGSVRGDVLFKGKINWEWDSSPGNIYRYSIRIPGNAIERRSSPLRVHDYIILIPDPRKVTNSEMEEILSRALELTDEEQTEYLDQYKDKLTYIIEELWNIPALK